MMKNDELAEWSGTTEGGHDIEVGRHYKDEHRVPCLRVGRHYNDEEGLSP